MEKYWCWWLCRFVYKTDRTCRGMRTYVDCCGAEFDFTPEQEAKLEVA